MKKILSLVLAAALLLAVAPAFIQLVWAGDNPPGMPGGNPPKPRSPPPNPSK
jgi:hypothetical protein